jgi:hypothetical protein
MITGVMGGLSGSKAFVARMDLNGDTAWTHQYGPTGSFGNRIRPDGFGGFLITGSVSNSATGNDSAPWLLRVDEDGSVMGLRHDPGPDDNYIVIVPNPAMDACRLDTRTALAIGTKWRLIDPLGHSVRLGTFSGSSYHMDLHGLLAGTYFVQVMAPGLPWKAVGPLILQN